ncbi:carbohydrate binding domain-containing protein [Paenibacillus roseipurpureus]|uniref:Carbohydrate binding domain-containing protein n=1 Tax=Paenibacillus roseopurpureus TaxID=2918901 RepID=A0AA96LTV2_9BACL|nr:carbohydrate binding domain-containing protein [Paenibacillus sp. MBLB1832]WNR45969.1 carbohydrate binding domain-containing protein [Paenibacillus sp. MBLB1832]
MLKNTNSIDTVYVGVKNYGGNDTASGVSGTSYSKGYVLFTTGSVATSADIYVWKSGGSGASYGDDVQVTPYLNIVLNPGFDSANLGSWSNLGGASVVASNSHSGSYGVRTASSNSGVQQHLTGLKANTTYVLLGWLSNGASSDTVYLGVKNYGGTEIAQGITGTTYVQTAILFKTGTASSSADIYIWKSGGTNVSYGDDIEVIPVP